MDGYQFEEQCAIILKRKHFSKIEVTKSSGDQGVDIIAYKHRKKYGIQCKYYTYPVGNKADVGLIEEARTMSMLLPVARMESPRRVPRK